MARTKATARRSLFQPQQIATPMAGMPSGPMGGMGMGMMSNWLQWIPFLAPLVGMLSQRENSSPYAYITDSLKLLLLGSCIEMGRRGLQWAVGRFRFQFTVTAHVYEGDPTHEWLINFLTEMNVWRRSCEFNVSAKSSARKWGVTAPTQFNLAGNADYVPTWTIPQLFRWKGYWVEVMKGAPGAQAAQQWNNGAFVQQGTNPGSAITITIYALRMSVLSSMIEEARERYIEAHKPHVIVHLCDGINNGGGNFSGWTTTKQKPRRPVSSVVLPDGKMNEMLEDMREFLDMEYWYNDLGIPHRRGYLLYGPPGTGKTSTIYSLAGELGLEIYNLPLGSGNVDDTGLQRAVSSAPKKCILLIEDIDCAFASRENEDDDDESALNNTWPPQPGVPSPFGQAQQRRSLVTMSGLLNVLDGVGSDEGKIFFATTNYIDRLDPALLRPGRVDKRIEYKLATAPQARALFARFFQPSRFPNLGTSSSDLEKHALAASYDSGSAAYLHYLGEQFAENVPPGEFSTAELQGYLLIYKKDPEGASRNVRAWAEGERAEKKAREERERIRKEKFLKKERARREQLANLGGGGMGMTGGAGMGGPGFNRGAWGAGGQGTLGVRSLGRDAPADGIPARQDVKSKDEKEGEAAPAAKEGESAKQSETETKGTTTPSDDSDTVVVAKPVVEKESSTEAK